MQSSIQSMKMILVSLLVTAMGTAGSGVAAEAVAPASSQAKQAPPAPLPPRPLQLPKPTSYKLSNGLTVILLEDHRVPFVTFQLGIKAGNSADPKDLPGVASITADMLTEGTTTRSAKQIANDTDRIGAAMKASTDADFTVLTGSSLSKSTANLFDLAADVTQHPSFPEEEFRLEKTNLLQELTMKRSNPGFLANERFSKVLFGDHPYAAVSPTPESVEKLSRTDLINFHKQHYSPSVASLVVVGDFTTDGLKPLIQKNFGGWTSGTAPAATTSSTPTRSGRMIYLVDRPGSVQSTVKIGNVAIKKNDPDYFSAMVANQVLGGSATSRLFLNIREQKGYTYGAYSGFTPRVEPGFFAAGADVRTPVTGPSLKEFLYELDRIRNTPVSDSELSSAKNYLVGAFQSSFETQANLAQRLLEQQLYNLPPNFLETYTSKVMAVSPEDVKRVAAKYIDYPNLAITVVGDAGKIENDLRDFGPVEVYDQSGKLVRKDEQKTKS
jgi:zinc protease